LKTPLDRTGAEGRAGDAKDPVKTNNDAFIEAKAAIQRARAARL